MIAVAATVATVPSPASAQGPQGDFEVVAARGNRSVGNAQAAYLEDDPQLVGRIVSFAGGTASFDGFRAPCDRVTATSVRTTARLAFRRLFPRRTSPNYPPYSVPADFRLPLPAGAPLTVVRYRCSASGRTGSAADDWNRAATFPLPQGRLGMVWIEDFVLVLAPRPRGTPTRAGFDCAKASTPVERTICADPVLAGWDRSVATAYRAKLEASGDDPAIVDDQRRWIAGRAKCGTDRNCLHESMSLRTRNLAR